VSIKLTSSATHTTHKTVPIINELTIAIRIAFCVCVLVVASYAAKLLLLLLFAEVVVVVIVVGGG